MTAEEAYQIIADYLLFKAQGVDWDYLSLDITIFYKGISHEHWILKGEKKFQSNIDAPFSVGPAAFFLRDSLYATIGARIWTIEYILDKNGKFKIDYGYEKPEGYDDSAEILPPL